MTAALGGEGDSPAGRGRAGEGLRPRRPVETAPRRERPGAASVIDPFVLKNGGRTPAVAGQAPESEERFTPAVAGQTRRVNAWSERAEGASTTDANQPPPAIGRASRGERLTRRRRRDPQRRGDVASDGTPPRPRPLRRAGVRTVRATENEPISLVLPLPHRPLVGDRPVVEAAGGHREDAAGSEPGVIVHGPCIGRRATCKLHGGPQVAISRPMSGASDPGPPEIAVQGILAPSPRRRRDGWHDGPRPRPETSGGRTGGKGGRGLIRLARRRAEARRRRLVRRDAYVLASDGTW